MEVPLYIFGREWFFHLSMWEYTPWTVFINSGALAVSSHYHIMHIVLRKVYYTDIVGRTECPNLASTTGSFLNILATKELQHYVYQKPSHLPPPSVKTAEGSKSLFAYVCGKGWLVFTLELILLLVSFYQTAIRNTTHSHTLEMSLKYNFVIASACFPYKRHWLWLCFMQFMNQWFCLSCVCVGVASVCNHKVT